MRWIAKAALQRGLGLLPQGERLNYLFQRHVARSLPGGEPVVRRKLARARQHLDAFGRPVEDAVFYEFGAGWDLAIPLSYAALEVGQQVLVDIRPSARVELVNETIALLNHTGELPPLGGPVSSLADLENRFGITYLAPRDARATGLESESIDFVTSTDVCEHIPEGDLAQIFRECRRLLRPGGAISCRVDLQDHHAYFDPSLSPYHFLRFSDRAWRLVNSPLHFQNRLREPDYRRLVEAAGLEIVSWTPSGPSAEGLAELEAMELAPRFRNGYTPEELGVTILSFVAHLSA
jgi:SAM-dependent methyltransferase